MQIPVVVGRYLVSRPWAVGFAAFVTIVVLGILGEVLSWTRVPLSPFSNIAGAALLVGGLVLHGQCHKVHRQAHESSQVIQHIVTTGLFGSVRHPMYTSLMLMYVGLALVWGIVWMLVPALVFSVATVLAAREEEEYLLNAFGPEYDAYMQTVRWRFIPRLF